MADNVSPEARSRLMSRVRQKGTRPELVLRKALHAAGLRYVLHPRHLPGRPDIVFPKYRSAVFVHGCFWHGHQCRAGRSPSSNIEYWSNKILANRKRDAIKEAALRVQGWQVILVWEYETKLAHFDTLVSVLLGTIKAARK